MGETPKPPTFYIYLLYNMATLQQCKWDGKCYQKNPQHIKEYSHPEQTMLKLKELKKTNNKTNNISNLTTEWKDSGTKREIYKAWLKWVTEKTLNKQFDENEKKEVFGILMNLEEDATGGEFKAADGKFKELLEAQGEHFKDRGAVVFSNSHLFPYLKPASDEPELPPSKRRRITTPKGGKKIRKSKKKTRKSKKRTRKSKTKRRKNI